MRYDECYKSIFSHRISVEHLLRFVEGMIDDGPAWIAAFDPETLEPVPTERIDDTLHRHLSDLIWRVRLRDGGEDDWAYLFVLIEFQSAVDHLMALRVRTYVDLLYRGLWADRRFGASDRLPPVLPVVLYNGLSPWSAAPSVEELVAPEAHPSAPAAPVPFYAGARYVALDVNRLGGGDSAPDDVVSLVIGIERMSSQEEGYATLVEAYSVLGGDEHRELRRVLCTWFGMVAGSDVSIGEFEEMERLHEAGELRETVQDRVRAWREADREQGRAEGVEKGRAEGVEKGRAEGVELGRAEGVEKGLAEGVEKGRAEGVEKGRAEGVEHERLLLRRLIERKFGDDTAGRAAALLAGIGEPGRLTDVGEWIIDCATGDELIARLENAD